MSSYDYVSQLDDAPSLEKLSRMEPLPFFSPNAFDFISDVSSALLESLDLRVYPELVALAYWMRKANLKRLQQTVLADNSERILVPRGLAFHIAPSNVDSIFVYSWFISLLSGNLNLIRLSSRESAQTRLLIERVAAVLKRPEHRAVAERTLLVRYDANNDINARFSDACQIRVIWGGDQTVAMVRQAVLPPGAVELAFSNKYSLALIDAAALLKADSYTRKLAAKEFFNDTFWFNQMACSSPRVVLWCGTEPQVDAARVEFWSYVEGCIQREALRFDASAYVRKLLATDTIALKSEQVVVEPSSNNVLTRLWQQQPDWPLEHHCGHGLILESRISELNSLRNLLNRKIQTVSYFGIEKLELLQFLRSSPVAGIDRVVPFGQALDFSPVWDGYDLFRSFTREITVI